MKHVDTGVWICILSNGINLVITGANLPWTLICLGHGPGVVRAIVTTFGGHCGAASELPPSAFQPGKTIGKLTATELHATYRVLFQSSAI